MAIPKPQHDELARRKEAIEEALRKGHRPPGTFGAGLGAIGIAAAALHIPRQTLQTSIRQMADEGLEPDWSLWSRPEMKDVLGTIPDGYKLKGTSTLYDMETGEGRLQWVKTDADKQRQEAMFREALAAMTEDLPRVKPIKAPNVANSDLLAGYPIGDHHIGMLSWAEETGADYDLSIAERLLSSASEHLINLAPPCARAVIAILADYMHYDGFESVTPTSKHQLDSDSRFPKMVRAAIRSVRRMADAALIRHENVLLIVETGNHDPATSVFLRESLAALYEKEPRVTVDTSPMHYHYFDFGKNLVGTHHGHGTKMQNLPMIMAADKPELWGRTTHRAWWTGHIHTSKTQAAMSAQDFSGCTVESFRILPPADAWAHQKGYRSIRDMTGIILHKDFGEVARYKVNPEMFRDGSTPSCVL